MPPSLMLFSFLLYTLLYTLPLPSLPSCHPHENSQSVDMEELTRNGVSVNLPKSELTQALADLSTAKLKTIRNDLFTETKRKGLCADSAIMVNRKDTASRPLSSKLSDDIWTMLNCLRHNTSIPRSVLRNGKRDRMTFEASQSGAVLEESTETLSPLPLHAVRSPPHELQPARFPPREEIATSVVMRELNLMKREIRDLKSSLSSLSRTQASDSTLRQEVANLRLTLTNALSRKVPSSDSSTSTRRSTCSLQASDNKNTSNLQTSICISAWNCWGLANAVPYLQTLAESSEVIVLAEHWLWPFELAKLDSVVPGFRGMGYSDSRLHDESSLTRGCGGVGVIWKSSLPVNFVPTNSDRIVAVQLDVSCSTILSIIGVYLPADGPLSVYKEYLQELENIVCALQTAGPVLITGDFNAHIGMINNSRAHCQSNHQGKLLMEMIDRTGHYAVSLSDLTTGPIHTYSSGGRDTTVDFCFLDCWAAHLVMKCEVQQCHPLNLSDHLSLSVKLSCKPQLVASQQSNRKLNWKKAISDGSILNFQNEVALNLSPLLEHPIQSIAELDEEIASVISLLHEAATATIPVIKHKAKTKNFIHDQNLRQLCLTSKTAWRNWRNAGRPDSGSAYMEMKSAKQEVKSYVKKCRAKQERITIQARDDLFKNKDERRFHLHRRRTECRKLVVNGTPITDDDELRTCWKNYFANLAKSQTSVSEPKQQQAARDIAHMEALSHGLEDFILDCPITIEEIESALKKLKPRRSGGADGLQAEHLKNAGPLLAVWLKRILNAIIHLEQIPQTFKLGMIVPVHKGKGRDPLLCSNYRGITLTSVLSKCFEVIILERLESLFVEQGFPHPSQTAYRRGLSCTDAIFSTQEVILKHIRDGDTPYLCFFDLEKAFDSVEYPTLLSHIFKLGVNGKCWRLIRNWYTDTSSVVKVNKSCSDSFPVHRGVKQGSVLSPTLFIAVMDSLLSYLESSGQGLTLLGLNVGNSAHADDVRAASISVSAAQMQGSLINAFCKANSLKLNADKTELVAMTKGKYSEHTHEMVGQDVISQTDAKCLGVWWRCDLSPVKSVEECIHKARRAFFALGSIGAFHGRLNPLTGRSLFETFVVPTMLYGCETWILSETHLHMLESFQAEIGKRILGISKYHANISTLIGLHWPSVKARILLRKLTYLAKVLEREDGLSSHVFRTLASEDVYGVSLVQQCRSLEQHIGTNYLQLCLSDPLDASSIVRDAKKEVLRKDWLHTVQNSLSHESLSIAASSEAIAASWNSIWDEALEFGVRGTRLMQGLFGALTTPIFGDRSCRHCNATISGTYSDHLFSEHIAGYDHDSVVQWLENKDFGNLFKLAEDIASLNFSPS